MEMPRAACRRARDPVKSMPSAAACPAACRLRPVQGGTGEQAGGIERR